MTTIDHVAWSRPEQERAGTPLVVALHGRGSDETSMAALAPHLPARVTVAAPRGPVDLGDGGFTWFVNRGIGRPIEESVQDSAAALLAWLDAVAPAHTSVGLLGFSGGTAMGGGLLLADPSRFAAAVLLSGTLPWDAGFDAGPGRLAGLPLLWAIDPADAMIPAELVARSEEWLSSASGADLEVRHPEGMGHGIGAHLLRDVAAFLDDRLA